MSVRTLQQVIPGLATSDGAGVRLRRTIGRSEGARLDPFLMLDEFSSTDPNDYIAGFPAHPHRGFETVTYLIDGHMLHEDHLGNRGDLKSGAVQWMTAGRGIIHSEMPQQLEGRMRGFQLWINLPAREKMKPAGYRDIPPSEIPVFALPQGGQAKVIAGEIDVDGRRIAGPMRGLTTEPLYVDATLPAGAALTLPIDPAHNAFVYPFEGSLQVLGDRDEDASPLPLQTAGVLSAGDSVRVRADPAGARFLLL
ncbi:MAG TPA: pirin family protein, partial [Burkholderiaceae bacterium]|nr:pirin family protein [Burkholderiaceae bacterium]